MRKTGVEPATARDIVRLSRSQNGAIKDAQLRSLGLTRDAIRARVARGRLVRRFPGVFVVGDPALMPLADASAALLSLGQDSLLSHRSSLAVRGLVQADAEVIDITVVARNPRPRQGVRLHRVRRPDRRDIATHRNLRLTATAPGADRVRRTGRLPRISRKR